MKWSNENNRYWKSDRKIGDYISLREVIDCVLDVCEEYGARDAGMAIVEKIQDLWETKRDADTN